MAIEQTEEDEQEKIKQYIEQHRKEIEKIIVTTTDSVPGREIIETFGLVEQAGNALFDGLYSREHPEFQLKYQAYEMGANAIIGYARRQEGYRIKFISHIGTAVRLKDKS